MELESYFEFLSEDNIRIKGTQIGIETVLDAYLAGAGPEEITVIRHPSLSLEQAYATITYYLCNLEEIDVYLNARPQSTKQIEQEYSGTPSESLRRLRKRIKNYHRTVIAEEQADYRLGETTLESYFDFLSEEDIRIKGTRVGIETVLDDYLEGSTPEEIAARYYSLSLEQVYATITYYFHYQAEVGAYLEAWHQYTEQAYQEWARNPSEEIKRLRRLKEKAQSAGS